MSRTANRIGQVGNALTGVVIALAMTITGAANATVIIYDNFGPGDSFNEGVGYALGGPDEGFGVQGFQFTAAVTGLMTSIDVGIGIEQRNVPPPKIVNFTLYTDNGANNIGAALETVSIATSNFFGTQATSSGVAAGSTLLAAGTEYWLIATVPDRTAFAWNYSDTAIGDRWVDGRVFPNEPLAALRINAVPEPGTISLLAMGLLACTLARRRVTA